MAFQDAFRVDENVELVVKTSTSVRTLEQCVEAVEHTLGASAGDKRIRIVNQRYSNEDMVALVGVTPIASWSAHRSAGFGYLMSTPDDVRHAGNRNALLRQRRIS